MGRRIISGALLASLVPVAAALALASGCEDTGSGEGEATSVICTVKDMRTGKTIPKAAMAELQDPIAKKILGTGEGCPKSFEDAQAKLRKTDNKSCKDERSGLKSRFISERSQAMGVPDSYRVVVSRGCDGRDDHEMLFSLFGIGFDGADPPESLPKDVEIIAFDRPRGLFSYYTIEGGKWSYFGTSKDFLEPNAGAKLRCANCHTGGGLIMKEQNQPWVHWEGKTDTPGTDALVAAFPSFGEKATGYNLEPTVKKGNTAWNATRIGVLRAKGIGEMLRPLFCSVEANIQTNGSTAVPTSINTDFLFDPTLGRTDKLTITAADYTALIGTNKQRIEDDDGTQLKKAGKNVVDTFFPFAYAERAQADIDYVAQLVSTGVVSASFVKDALMVDFTRPVFSDARCSLVSFAPTTSTTPDEIQAGFIKSLEAKKPAAGTPGAVFLANLKDTNDNAKQDTALGAFVTACKARPKKDLLTDVLKVASARRDRIRERPIMEFAESLPVDETNANANSALDAVTCTLTTK